jgi:2-polyprenyl-6-methoxyphenol hydroxylase-like FAD-dependent oxidoreductase
MAEGSPRREHVTCCIAGGGPAGMMLGFLLARAGVDVAVLERHADFFRDFRGDTIHPSTLEVMHELGLLEEFLKRPHDEARELGGQVGDTFALMADLSHLPTRCKFIAIMPQWDFLDFIAAAGRRYPGFRAMMKTDAVDLITGLDGRVSGVRATSPDGPIELTADLVVGADGRHSTVRAKGGFAVEEFGAPIDVLWIRMSRRPSDSGQALGHADRGGLLVQIGRQGYWQCGFVIAKGSFEERKAKGLDAFRAEIGRFAPQLADRTHEIAGWDDVKLLTVVVDRVRTWHRPGLLLIGDAAHAMSPIGGVGVNLAIQDAVAAANILAAPLLRRGLAEADLAAVQKRREWPARMTQRLQLFVQDKFLARLLKGDPVAPPLPFRLLRRYPLLRRIPARFIGMGFRPEHIARPG